MLPEACWFVSNWVLDKTFKYALKDDLSFLTKASSVNKLWYIDRPPLRG
jgi:hypothetical protein